VRRRLLIAYLLLTAVLVLGTEIPLGFALAMDTYHHMVIHQVSDTLALASAAEEKGKGTSAWQARTGAYSREHDVVVLLFDEQGRLTDSTRPGIAVTSADWRDELQDALTGKSAVPLDYPININAQPLFVAEPVLQNGNPVGAVATITSTAGLRMAVARDAGVLLAVALAALAASTLLAVRLVRWSLAPARCLESTARKIAQGEYTARAPTDHGPVELRELAEAVNGMTDRLVSVLEAQRSFAADASHQMRNPLTALRLRVESLETVVPEAGREALAVAVSEAARLGRILDELLALARASAPETGADTVELRSVAQSRARTWSSRAEEAGVTIAVQGRRAATVCQPGALDQVLDVLLDNAISFSPPGGRITVRVRTDDSSVSVEVEDQGPGIPGADKEHAADRFWRGRQPEGRNGSGLGLAIAKALLKASNGHLELRDAVPHGLLARAVLPRAASASAVIAAVEAAPPRIGACPRGGRSAAQVTDRVPD
jgi:signal transduction histidine kinase